MGKRKMSEADAERYDRLKRENQLLKRQIARLQKQLSRVDLEKFENLQDAVNAVEKEDTQFHHKLKKEDMKKKWECHKCHEGYLRLIILNRMGDVYYIRRCKECGHKTKPQRYSEKVEGVKE